MLDEVHRLEGPRLLLKIAADEYPAVSRSSATEYLLARTGYGERNPEKQRCSGMCLACRPDRV
jgi:hypothetical protein